MRLASLFVLGFGAAVALAGCAVGSAQAPGASAPMASSHLDAVQKSALLRICTPGDYKPFSFQKPDTTYEGIDVDLMANFSSSLGAKPEWVKTTWANLLPDLAAGKCDIAVGGVSTTLDRQKRAFFTQPYMVDGKTAIVRCDDVGKYQTVAEIDQPGVRTIVNPGGTNERFAKQYFRHSQLIEYPDNVTIFEQILDGHADVMVTDASETLLQQKLHPGLCSVHPDKPFQFGEKAYLLPRGDVPFQQYVDQWLHLARSTGEFQAVVDKWLK